MFTRLNISSKFAIVFALVITGAIIAISYIAFHSAENSLKNSRILELESIASLKVEKIETLFADLKKDLMVAQDYFNIRSNLPKLAEFENDKAHPFYVAAKKMLDDQLLTFQRVKGGIDILLVNRTGSIVYTTADDAEAGTANSGGNLPDPDGRAFEEGKKGIFFSDIFDDPAGGRFVMLITAPIHDLSGVFEGVVAFKVRMDPIYAFIQDTTGLGKTGETLIGKRAGNNALFLNPLRYDPDAALRRTAIIGEKNAYPIQEAVLGRAGSGLSIDYRGEKIVAVWRYIPSLGWGMVAKIDAVEAFAPIADLKMNIAYVALIILVVSLVVSLVFSKTITRPIKDLSEVAYKISKGDFELRADTNSGDEVGRLANSFNQMADSLIETNTRLENQAGELTRSNEELQQFAYVASHDLQEPLRMVSSYTQLLGKRYRGKLDSDADDFIAYAVDGAVRMQNLINDLLKYSRVGTRGKPFEQTDCTRTLDSALANLRAGIEESGAIVTSGPLPTVMADETQLLQLFQNLIGNAVKYHRESPVQVHISAESNNGNWRFAVRDNGIGFDQQYSERIFMIFQRLHNKEMYRGTGIGLALCKKIVGRHGGQIWAESEAGRGSTFYFTIPTMMHS